MSKQSKKIKPLRKKIEQQPEPLGFYRISDHGIDVSIIRYYTQSEKEEILTLSKLAQNECTLKHPNKIGKCCMLFPSNKDEWNQWHPPK
jgi:hypothetical protein